MLPFIINTFARFLATIVATCTKGALPCRKETKTSLNGFVSETATNGKRHKKLGRSQIFIHKLLATYIFFIYIFSDAYPQNVQIMLF